MCRCFLTHRTFLTAQDKHQLPNQAWQSLQNNAPPSPQPITFSSHFVTAPSYGASHTASATSSCIAEMQTNKMLPLKSVAGWRALRPSLTSQPTACPDSLPPTLRNTLLQDPPIQIPTMSRPRHRLSAHHSNPLYSPLRVFARRCLPPPIFSLGVSLDRRGSTSPYACSSTPPASFPLFIQFSRRGCIILLYKQLGRLAHEIKDLTFGAGYSPYLEIETATTSYVRNEAVSP